MKIKKFNEEFFSGADSFDSQDTNNQKPGPRRFTTDEVDAYRSLEKLRKNLEISIDLLDKQLASKEAHPEVLKTIIEKTEEYNRFLLTFRGDNL